MNSLKFINILIWGLLICKIASPQTMYDTYTGWTTPTTPVLPPSEVHPKLLFDSTQITEIKNRATYDAYFDTLWKKITTNINYYRTKTASAMDENDRPRMAKYCAFAWLMNNDATAKQKAIDALMIAFDNVPRTTVPSSFDGDYDEIYRATWLQNYCEAYDWIKSQLTPAQDDTIRRKLINETCILRNHMVDSTKYAPRPHNHRSKPAYAIATAALTFSSDSRAAGWLQFALTQLNTVTKYQFSSDGIYREGGHYNLYSAVNGIPFLWHYKNVSGVDFFTYYKPMFENAVAVRMGQGWIPIFEDSFLKPYPGHMAARAYTSTSTYLHTSASLSTVLQWSFFNTNIFIQNYTGATNDVCWDIYEYIFYDHTITKTAPNVTPSINLAGGQTILRKNWNYQDKSNRYLVFHGVAEADNHNHPDNLSFNIEAENSIMATNCGYGPAGASDPKRNAWYLQPFANNLITVDDQQPKDFGTNITPKTYHFLTSANFGYVEKDAYYDNGAFWRRGISFPHQNYFIVRDIVISSTQRTSKCYLHGRGTLYLSGINAKWTTPANYGSSAIFDSYNINSAGSSVTSTNGYLSLFWGVEETAPYITQQISDTCSLFFSVIFPRSLTSTAPVVNTINQNYGLYFSVAYGDTTDYHFFQKDFLNRTIGAITSDGIYVWFSSKAGKATALSLIDGTSLSFNNSSYLTATERVSISVQYDNLNNALVTLDTVSQSTTINLKLPFPSSQLNVLMLNGTLKTYSVTGDSSISFSLNTINSLDIYSVTNGNWNNPAVWSSNTVPTTADNVVISTGTQVTINSINQGCSNLNIEPGAFLYFSNTDSTSFNIYGDLVVASTGVFSTQARAISGNAINHSVTLLGNLYAQGTLDFRTGTGSNPTSTVCVANITLSGTASTYINAPDNADFNSISINKSGGASISVRSNITQNNNSTTAPAVLYLNSGICYLDTVTWKVLSTSNAAGVQGGSAGSYIAGGTLYRQISTGTNLTRIYPVGDSAAYRPITVYIPTGASNFPISVTLLKGKAAVNGTTYSGGIDKVSYLRYYKITNHHATSSMGFSSFALGYNSDDGVSAGNYELRLGTSSNNRLTWQNIGPDSSGSRKHLTTLASPPVTIRSDDISGNLNLTAGNSAFITLAQTTGGKLNTLGKNTISLRLFPEGLYKQSADTTITDTIKVILKNSSSPFNSIDTAVTTIDRLGYANAEFENVINGNSYYVTIKHRNSIETWSKTTESFSNYRLNYDFSTAATKAYGDNLILKGTRWCIYSGDVNQDGQISLDDLLIIDNDNQNFATGYLSTDVNGDGQITLDDLLITDTNNQNFITIQRP